MFLRRMITGALFFGALGFGSYCWAANEPVTPTANNDTLQMLPQTPISLTELKKDIRSLSQQDLVAIASDMLTSCGDSFTPEQLKACIEVQANIIDHLRTFKVTGVAFAVDPNLAFIFNTQNPKFDLYFKNDAGELKHRKYQAAINTIGLKIEFAVNLNVIFFINTDLNYFDANTVIPLSWGGEIMPLFYPAFDTQTCNIPTVMNKLFGESSSPALDYADGYSRSTPIAQKKHSLADINIPIPVSGAALTLTYASLPTHGGGMLMASLGFGLKCEIASLVTGGSLTPVEQKIPEKYLSH